MTTAATTTSPPEPVTLDAAFAAAKDEHSQPAEKTPAGGEHALPAAKGPKDDEPPAASSTPPAAASTAKEPAETITDTLISDEEFERLKTTHADDPAALRKALNTAFTTKLQALATDRRALEGWTEIVQAFEEDPETALAELADQFGLTLTKADGAAGPTTATTVAKAAVTTAVDDFKNALPEDYKFLGDELAPAFQKLAESIAQSVVTKHVEPLKAQAGTLVERAAREQTEQVMGSFTKAHPDWQTHEAKMMAIGQRLQPNGMSELEYLDTLYFLATKDSAASTAATKAIERMAEAAASAEPATRGTSESRVAHTPPARPTLDEAFSAARRGERWE